MVQEKRSFVPCSMAERFSFPARRAYAGDHGVIVEGGRDQAGATTFFNEAGGTVNHPLARPLRGRAGQAATRNRAEVFVFHDTAGRRG